MGAVVRGERHVLNGPALTIRQLVCAKALEEVGQSACSLLVRAVRNPGAAAGVIGVLVVLDVNGQVYELHLRDLKMPE